MREEKIKDLIFLFSAKVYIPLDTPDHALYDKQGKGMNSTIEARVKKKRISRDL